MLPLQLRPFRELILTAGCVELQAHTEVLLLKLPILDNELGRLDRELVQDAP